MNHFNNMNPYIFQLLGELSFWISLSREHPLFIKEIAQCQHIVLDPPIRKLLNKNYRDFSGLHKNIAILREQSRINADLYPSQKNSSILLEASANLHNVMKVNMDFLDVLKTLHYIDTKNKTWRTFVNHLSLEQKHFLQICTSYSIQLKSMGY